MNDGLFSLKSGTDIRGAASGDNIALTDEIVKSVCSAFCVWLAERSKKRKLKIAIGNDSRISAGRMVNAAKSALLNCGCDVVYCGLSSTPSMFMLLKSGFGCDGSVMVTASHMPKDKNGLKFFTPDGGIDAKELDDILAVAARGVFPQGKGEYSEKSFMPEYSRILVEKVRADCKSERPLLGKKVIVDAGNGAGGFFAKDVLEPLGADISGSVNLDPDGNFPDHVPNPEDKGAIDKFAAVVVGEGADLGIIFDTDVDRAGCVDRDGREINRNTLIALVSAILLKERPGVIVTDSVTSEGLSKFIKNRGGEHLRFKRGYKNVIDKCKELNESGIYSPLAIETSGHAAFAENYYLDDGAYLAARLLQLLTVCGGKPVCTVIPDLEIPAEEAEVRITFSEKSKNFKAEGGALIEELKALARGGGDFRLADTNYEGARIYCDADSGWALVRQSVHDPVLPLNFESAKKGGIKHIAQKLYKILKNYEYLDLHNLEKFLIND